MEQWWKNLKFKRQQWWRQKAKSTNKCFIKSKLKLKKNKIDLDSPKEFIKNIRLILKTRQRFKSERHIVFTE